MKIKYGFMVLLLGLSASAYAADIVLETEKQKVSYILGYQAGSQLKQGDFDIDFDSLTAAIKEGLDGKEPRLTGEQAAAVMQAYQAKQQAQQAEKGKANAEAGKAFLAANKGKPGVTTLENGLQYKVIKAGNGNQPKESDAVTVHYRGTTIDGKEFDSSYKRGQPASFPVKGVIPGWTQILQLMKEGAKWQVFIPSELAYGPRGAGGDIGPDSTLIFDIELIAIKAN